MIGYYKKVDAVYRVNLLSYRFMGYTLTTKIIYNIELVNTLNPLTY